ncbi:MAG: vitamin B12 dependent-methionine synthase activation domain-containing protein [Prolixibacteraceae bacterium]|nr:vitamin B12 dependent-methionine synthase activation domain-containing protein [Prolixibacteraceae bacterium]
MIREISYSLSELTIDVKYLSSMLGFPEGDLPEPFGEYVAQAIQEAESLCDIRGAFCVSENCKFSTNNNHILVEGLEFGVGKTVAKELRNATSVAFFICTAGERISSRSQELLSGDDPVLGYVFDLLGSIIVESATDLLQADIQRMAFSEGLQITNRYSPGYCKWNVADQHKLFSFFPTNCCGIRLTDSALMHPIKSVSGIIGLGADVSFRDYTCDLCNQVDCFQRSHRRTI